MERYQNLTDEELLNRYQTEQDTDCLGQLLQRYTLMLLAVSMKYLRKEELARDAVQQVFLKVIPELEKYKVTYFKSWIYQIAKNHCLIQLREQKKWGTPQPADQLPLEGNAAVDQEYWNEKEQSLNHLSEALTTLPEGQRECVTLFYLQKMSYRQVSEKTGMAVATVKSHIQNGKRNLRIALMPKKTSEGHGR
ncbi:MAG: sigma-70 family RNA polymerase sigma factor [Bacteroidetes bacterium]|nr:sigma-70 family RNA polymerase sigma factor [Bacteroidota bacterium]